MLIFHHLSHSDICRKSQIFLIDIYIECRFVEKFRYNVWCEKNRMISIGADVFDCIENNDKRTNRIATAYIALVCNVLRGKN